jgi:DNA (cytosine-5)-methyltransferase 1
MLVNATPSTLDASRTDGATSLPPARSIPSPWSSPDPRFRFVDLFAGIGGIRAGLQGAHGRCEFTVENNLSALATYWANWGTTPARDIREVKAEDLPAHELLAAGFPCQPFSLAGVSKKNHLRRQHGFEDPTSGNLFFEIVRLIGGPLEDATVEEAYSDLEGPEEVDEFQVSEPTSQKAPPVLLLENVRHLVSHDQRRTFRVIRRRLMRSGYRVSHAIVNGAGWVPQNRRRVIIVGLRADLFADRFEFKSVPSERDGPRLDGGVLLPEGPELERYRLTVGVWNALQRHRARHELKGTGFGYGIARRGGVTRTLSARYYKDGAEILIEMTSGERPRRLTPRECANLMGFTAEELGFEFRIPVSDRQAYQQLGNSVVVPQFRWIAERIVDHAGDIFAKHIRDTSPA